MLATLVPSMAGAQSTSDLQAQIASLMAQIQQLQAQLAQQQGGGEGRWCHTFNADLTVGAVGEEVSALENALAREGYNVEHSSNFSSIFSENTAAAVVQFQAKYGIRQTGYVGPLTRGKLNSLYGCEILPPSDNSIKARLNVPFTLKIRQEAVVTDYKNVEISLDSITQAAIYCIQAPCPQPPAYAVLSVSDQQLNKAESFSMKAGDKRQIFGMEISMTSVGGQQATMVVSTVSDPEPVKVSEQVKCVFNGSNTEQRCYTATDQTSPYHELGCSSQPGQDACVVNVTGNRGDAITWKSSCGEYAYTTMDGTNEYATFQCSTTPQLSLTVRYPNGGESLQRGASDVITWTQNLSKPVNIYLQPYSTPPQCSYTNPPCALPTVMLAPYQIAANVLPQAQDKQVYNWEVGRSTISGGAIPDGVYQVSICTVATGRERIYCDQSDSFFKIFSGDNNSTSTPTTLSFGGYNWTPLYVTFGSNYANGYGNWIVDQEGMKQETASSLHYKIVARSMAAMSDYDVQAVVRFRSGSEIGLCGRMDDNGRGYCLTTAWGGSNTATLSIFKNADQDVNYMDVDGWPQVPISPNTDYILKLRFQGNMIYGKAYPAGGTEPDWQMKVSDTQFSSGKIGFYSYAGRPIIKSVSVVGLSQTTPPTVTLSANPTSIVSDGKPGTVVLSWNSTNANSCAYEKTNLATSGSMPVSLTQTSIYTISCTGPGGSTTSNPVTVVFSPFVSSPIIINAPEVAGAAPGKLVSFVVNVTPVATLTSVPIIVQASNLPLGSRFLRKGDVNRDGAITQTDSVIILRTSLGTYQADSEQRILADVDGNGAIEKADSDIILHALLTPPLNVLPNTYVFLWTPTASQAGSSNNVEFYANTYRLDASDRKTTVITVAGESTPTSTILISCTMPGAVKVGDFDRDGSISLTELSRMANINAGSTPTADELKIGDGTGDGRITTADITIATQNRVGGSQCVAGPTTSTTSSSTQASNASPQQMASILDGLQSWILQIQATLGR